MMTTKHPEMHDIPTRFWVDFLTSIVSETDAIARHYFDSKSFRVDLKDNATPVSDADLKIETIIRDYISKQMPKLEVLGEEHGSCEKDAPYKLIVDPIDATSNFIRGIPVFATLLAIEINGQIVAGLVSAPATNDRWWASLNNGAYYNGDPIQVSTINSLSTSQAFYGGLFGNEARGDRDKLLHLLSHSKRQRGFGDYLTHLMVAQGLGEFAIDFGLAPWDLGPLGIIVTEAGGTITQVNGDPFSIYEQSILSSNGQFHPELIRLYLEG